MDERLRLRFWIETGMAAASGLLFLATVLWRNWIELAFGVDPDHSNGALEWLLVATALTASVSVTVMARREWQRRQAAAA